MREKDKVIYERKTFDFYCTRKWDGLLYRRKYVYEAKFEGGDMKLIKVKNPMYKPNFKVPKKPRYCKNRITVDCINHKCKFLIAEVGEDEGD